MAKKSSTVTGSKKKSSSGPSAGESLVAILKDSRSRTVGGLLLVVVSLFLFVAFISYLVVGHVDESQVKLPLLDSIDTSNDTSDVQNTMGGLGAIVGRVFIYKGFGIAAFLFPIILFLTGFRVLFRFSILSIRKTIRHSIFLLYWLPLSTALLFNNGSDASGSVGSFLNRLLGDLIGTAGTSLLVVASALIYLAVSFNLTIDRITSLFKKSDVGTDKETDWTTPEEMELEKDVTITTNELDLAAAREAESATETSMEIDESVDETPLPITDEVKKEASSTSAPEDENVEFQIEEVAAEEEVGEAVDEEMENYDPTLDLSFYKHPPIDLLEQHGSTEVKVDREELESNKNRIVQTLSNYNIDIDKIKATIGPTVTLYEIVPAPGVRISKIKNLEDDIALSLAALGIRIIAPIPGRGTIGIEVPNSNPDIVSMRSVIASEKFQHAKMDLPIALGKTISNETFVTDLAKMPHLLMAGATGQGKSVGLNAILASILYRKHPAQVKFVLVDPKKVELTLYNKIERHFLAKLPDTEEAIITDTSKVVTTLNSLCIEMDQRYELLKNAQVRNLKEYNAKFIARKLNPLEGHRYMPFIVLVVDEFADLIMTAGKEVETPIARLAQLARAIGIHLIIATQRPSVNIITGTIKANFPARIAFRVTSKIDSRTILDAGGAEQLIGRGDMLLSTGSDLIRLQCAFLDTPEVEKICDYIGSQQAYPDAFILPEVVDSSGGGEAGAVDLDDRDAMFEEAARIVVQHQQGSASLLQRRLKLGYNRAGRIVDQLEAAGIIGPFEGSKARQVLIPDEHSLEQLLNNQL